MDALSPSSLATDTLARRLAHLVGDERQVQVTFLLHLDVFDQRRGWAEAGYPSLWEYMQRVLHLREGAAWRRVTAMRALRRFPQLAEQLRDGRVCLTTLALLAPVLTDENVADVVAAAAFQSKREVERIVAGLAPRPAPKDGIRKLPARDDARGASPLPLEAAPARHPAPAMLPAADDGSPALTQHAIPSPTCAAAAPAASCPATVRPVAAETYSLHVTLDAGLKAELDELVALLGHKVPNRDLTAVLRVAVRCAIDKFGKRKGARPVRERAPAAARESASVPATATGRPPIPAAVRREVWARDAGQCTFRGPDGQRCPARTRLEYDHIVPVALGGRSTVENLRLACREHNLLHAEEMFGRERIARFRRGPTSPGGTGRRSGRGALGDVEPETPPGPPAW